MSADEILRLARERAERRAEAMRNVEPHLENKGALPEGTRLTGLTIQRNAEGEVVQYWQKQAPCKLTPQEIIEEFKAAVASSDFPAAAASSRPPHEDKDTMTWYPAGDPHFGMHAWAPEAGHDFDIGIAVGNFKQAASSLVDSAPTSAYGGLVVLGDMFHADNKLGVTNRSGNVLDMDTRLPKIIRAGMETMIWLCHRLLSKHGEVNVFILPGNHDELSAYWLSLCIDTYFRNEPRLRVNLSPAKHQYFRFGRCLLGMAHGDTEKPKDLPQMMAADMPKAWGESEHRFFWIGHVHHQNVYEFPGCVVESFNTLAPNDAWHRARPSFRSRRMMVSETWHRELGVISRRQYTLRVDV